MSNGFIKIWNNGIMFIIIVMFVFNKIVKNSLIIIFCSVCIVFGNSKFFILINFWIMVEGFGKIYGLILNNEIDFFYIVMRRIS